MLSKIISSGTFYSQSTFINWLQNHLIRCPFKFATGIDCPLCGFQRSVLQLIQGNFYKSFMLYPPAIPLLICFVYILADQYLRPGTPKNSIKKILFVFIGGLILLNYGVKLSGLYLHYKTSV